MNAEGLLPHESSPAACPADRPDLVHSQAIGVIGCQRALCARVVERPQTEEDRKRVLDDLHVGLARLAEILLAGTGVS